MFKYKYIFYSVCVHARHYGYYKPRFNHYFTFLYARVFFAIPFGCLTNCLPAFVPFLLALVASYSGVIKPWIAPQEDSVLQFCTATTLVLHLALTMLLNYVDFLRVPCLSFSCCFCPRYSCLLGLASVFTSLFHNCKYLYLTSIGFFIFFTFLAVAFASAGVAYFIRTVSFDFHLYKVCVLTLSAFCLYQF